MAELIDREALREKFNNTGKVGMSHISIDKIIRDMPTTTEAEIRAKAIDEFADKLLEEVEANPVDVGGRYSYMIPQSFLEGQIKDIAEQLKEE